MKCRQCDGKGYLDEYFKCPTCNGTGKAPESKADQKARMNTLEQDPKKGMHEL